MVKGRRVKAVVACARNDDCCSPNPKRRGQKIAFEGAVLKPATITAFFQSVDVEERRAHGDEFVIALMEDGVDDVQRNCPTTPVIVKGATACNEGQPQTTPHRIELCPAKDAPKAKKRQNGQPKVTEYFPVRRSVRKTKRTVLEERQRSLEQMLRSETEEGLEVRVFEDKGRGVVAAKPFAKGDFVVEYSGDLIDLTEAKRREHRYAQDLNAGCYMYYFKHNNQQYCVDATAETGKLGRLVNHSRNGNLITRTVSVDNKPRLVLIAKDDIKEGDEITYDYGDRSKESLKHHPWLAY